MWGVDDGMMTTQDPLTMNNMNPWNPNPPSGAAGWGNMPPGPARAFGGPGGPYPGQPQPGGHLPHAQPPPNARNWGDVPPHGAPPNVWGAPQMPPSVGPNTWGQPQQPPPPQQGWGGLNPNNAPWQNNVGAAANSYKDTTRSKVPLSAPMRPMSVMPSGAPRMDGQAGWGAGGNVGGAAKVDQTTPWDVGGATHGVAAGNQFMKPPSNMGLGVAPPMNDWNSQNKGRAGDGMPQMGNWAPEPPAQNMNMLQQQPPPPQHWGGPGAGMPPQTPQQNMPNNDVTGTGMWQRNASQQPGGDWTAQAPPQRGMPPSVPPTPHPGHPNWQHHEGIRPPVRVAAGASSVGVVNVAQMGQSAAAGGMGAGPGVGAVRGPPDVAGASGTNWDNPQNPAMWVPPGPQGMSSPKPWNERLQQPMTSSSCAAYGTAGYSNPNCNSFYNSTPLASASAFSQPAPTVPVLFTQSTHTSTNHNNDMVWVNPNPKPKKVQPDKGTSVWGDPSHQGDIKRWKCAEEGSAGTSANTSLQTQHGGGSSVWDSSPVAPQQASAIMPTGNPNSMNQPQSMGWGDPPTAAGTPHEWQGNNTTNNAGSMNTQQPPPQQLPPSGNWTNPQPGKVQASQSMPAPAPPSAYGQSRSNNTQPGNVQHRPDGMASMSSDMSVFGSSNVATPITSGGPNKMGMLASGQPTLAHSLGMSGDQNGVRPAQTANGNGNGQLQQLTNQIADHLRVAVLKGFINLSVLHSPLQRETLLYLNELLQRVPKLEQAQADLQSAAGSERTRLEAEINRLQTEIADYQQRLQTTTPANDGTQPITIEQFNTQTQAQTNGATSPQDLVGSANSGSKLAKWTNVGDGGAGARSVDSGSAPLESLLPEMAALAMFNQNQGGLGAQDSLWAKLDANKVDWSPPINDASVANKNKGSTGAGSEKDPRSGGASERGEDGSLSPKEDVLVQEFVPGKPWNWRDPTEIATDPNATPGSIKPLVGLTLGNNSANSVGGTTPIGNGPGTGHNTPTKPFGDQRLNVGMSPASVDGGWQQSSRPVSTLGQPFAGSQSPARLGLAPSQGGYPRSMSSPGQMPAPAFWIILHNLAQVSEQQVRALCNQTGKVLQLVQQQSAGLVCVRFQDMGQGPSQVHHRLSQELAPHCVSVSVAKDGDVERLMQQQSQARNWPPNDPSNGPPPPTGAGAATPNWAQAPPGFAPAQAHMDMHLGMPPPTMGDNGERGGGAY